jgi:hypothetical protein
MNSKAPYFDFGHPCSSFYFDLYTKACKSRININPLPNWPSGSVEAAYLRFPGRNALL